MAGVSNSPTPQVVRINPLHATESDFGDDSNFSALFAPSMYSRFTSRRMSVDALDNTILQNNFPRYSQLRPTIGIDASNDLNLARSSEIDHHIVDNSVPEASAHPFSFQPPIRHSIASTKHDPQQTSNTAASNFRPSVSPQIDGQRRTSVYFNPVTESYAIPNKNDILSSQNYSASPSHFQRQSVISQFAPSLGPDPTNGLTEPRVSVYAVSPSGYGGHDPELNSLRTGKTFFSSNTVDNHQLQPPNEISGLNMNYSTTQSKFRPSEAQSQQYNHQSQKSLGINNGNINTNINSVFNQRSSNMSNLVTYDLNENGMIQNTPSNYNSIVLANRPSINTTVFQNMSEPISNSQVFQRESEKLTKIDNNWNDNKNFEDSNVVLTENMNFNHQLSTSPQSTNFATSPLPRQSMLNPINSSNQNAFVKTDPLFNSTTVTQRLNEDSKTEIKPKMSKSIVVNSPILLDDKRNGIIASRPSNLDNAVSISKSNSAHHVTSNINANNNAAIDRKSFGVQYSASLYQGQEKNNAKHPNDTEIYPFDHNSYNYSVTTVNDNKVTAAALPPRYSVVQQPAVAFTSSSPPRYSTMTVVNKDDNHNKIQPEFHSFQSQQLSPPPRPQPPPKQTVILPPPASNDDIVLTVPIAPRNSISPKLIPPAPSLPLATSPAVIPTTVVPPNEMREALNINHPFANGKQRHTIGEVLKPTSSSHSFNLRAPVVLEEIMQPQTPLLGSESKVDIQQQPPLNSQQFVAQPSVLQSQNLYQNPPSNFRSPPRNNERNSKHNFSEISPLVFPTQLDSSNGRRRDSAYDDPDGAFGPSHENLMAMVDNTIVKEESEYPVDEFVMRSEFINSKPHNSSPLNCRRRYGEFCDCVRCLDLDNVNLVAERVLGSPEQARKRREMLLQSSMERQRREEEIMEKIAREEEAQRQEDENKLILEMILEKESEEEALRQREENKQQLLDEARFQRELEEFRQRQLSEQAAKERNRQIQQNKFELNGNHVLGCDCIRCLHLEDFDEIAPSMTSMTQSFDYKKHRTNKSEFIGKLLKDEKNRVVDDDLDVEAYMHLYRQQLQTKSKNNSHQLGSMTSTKAASSRTRSKSPQECLVKITKIINNNNSNSNNHNSSSNNKSPIKTKDEYARQLVELDRLTAERAELIREINGISHPTNKNSPVAPNIMNEIRPDTLVDDFHPPNAIRHGIHARDFSLGPHADVKKAVSHMGSGAAVPAPYDKASQALIQAVNNLGGQNSSTSHILSPNRAAPGMNGRQAKILADRARLLMIAAKIERLGATHYDITEEDKAFLVKFNEEQAARSTMATPYTRQQSAGLDSLSERISSKLHEMHETDQQRVRNMKFASSPLLRQQQHGLSPDDIATGSHQAFLQRQREIQSISPQKKLILDEFLSRQKEEAERTKRLRDLKEFEERLEKAISLAPKCHSPCTAAAYHAYKVATLSPKSKRRFVKKYAKGDLDEDDDFDGHSIISPEHFQKLFQESFNAIIGNDGIPLRDQLGEKIHKKHMNAAQRREREYRKAANSALEHFQKIRKIQRSQGCGNKVFKNISYNDLRSDSDSDSELDRNRQPKTQLQPSPVYREDHRHNINKPVYNTFTDSPTNVKIVQRRKKPAVVTESEEDSSKLLTSNILNYEHNAIDKPNHVSVNQLRESVDKSPIPPNNSVSATSESIELQGLRKSTSRKEKTLESSNVVNGDTFPASAVENNSGAEKQFPNESHNKKGELIIIDMSSDNRKSNSVQQQIPINLSKRLSNVNRKSNSSSSSSSLQVSRQPTQDSDNNNNINSNNPMKTTTSPSISISANDYVTKLVESKAETLEEKLARAIQERKTTAAAAAAAKAQKSNAVKEKILSKRQSTASRISTASNALLPLPMKSDRKTNSSLKNKNSVAVVDDNLDNTFELPKPFSVSLHHDELADQHEHEITAQIQSHNQQQRYEAYPAAIQSAPSVRQSVLDAGLGLNRATSRSIVFNENVQQKEVERLSYKSDSTDQDRDVEIALRLMSLASVRRSLNDARLSTNNGNNIANNDVLELNRNLFRVSNVSQKESALEAVIESTVNAVTNEIIQQEVARRLSTRLSFHQADSSTIDAVDQVNARASSNASRLLVNQHHALGIRSSEAARQSLSIKDVARGSSSFNLDLNPGEDVVAAVVAHTIAESVRHSLATMGLAPANSLPPPPPPTYADLISNKLADAQKAVQQNSFNVNVLDLLPPPPPSNETLEEKIARMIAEKRAAAQNKSLAPAVNPEAESRKKEEEEKRKKIEAEALEERNKLNELSRLRRESDEAIAVANRLYEAEENVLRLSMKVQELEIENAIQRKSRSIRPSLPVPDDSPPLQQQRDSDNSRISITVSKDLISSSHPPIQTADVAGTRRSEKRNSVLSRNGKDDLAAQLLATQKQENQYIHLNSGSSNKETSPLKGLLTIGALPPQFNNNRINGGDTFNSDHQLLSGRVGVPKLDLTIITESRPPSVRKSPVASSISGSSSVNSLNEAQKLAQLIKRTRPPPAFEDPFALEEDKQKLAPSPSLTAAAVSSVQATSIANPTAVEQNVGTFGGDNDNVQAKQDEVKDSDQHHASSSPPPLKKMKTTGDPEAVAAFFDAYEQFKPVELQAFSAAICPSPIMFQMDYNVIAALNEGRQDYLTDHQKAVLEWKPQLDQMIQLAVEALDLKFFDNCHKLKTCPPSKKNVALAVHALSADEDDDFSWEGLQRITKACDADGECFAEARLIGLKVTEIIGKNLKKAAKFFFGDGVKGLDPLAMKEKNESAAVWAAWARLMHAKCLLLREVLALRGNAYDW